MHELLHTLGTDDKYRRINVFLSFQKVFITNNLD